MPQQNTHAGTAFSGLDTWLQELAAAIPEFGELLAAPPEEQQRRGYYHTLREICQQPFAWEDTCARMLACREELASFLGPCSAVAVTGSGSSEYAGLCLEPALAAELGRPVRVVGGGWLLTHAESVLPPLRPLMLVSLARSGNSPESVGALDTLLEIEPQVRHLIISCNAAGRLATSHAAHPLVFVVTLHPATNDESLVMTSSFTSMVVAARLLGRLDRPDVYRDKCEKLCMAARQLLRVYTGACADFARTPSARAIFLGSGAAFGAARESALKMLEMTAGKVITFAETYLGLRHGPMSAIHDDTLVVCFLSPDPLVRAYETDLIEELNHKRLGARKLLMGENIPRRLLRDGDVAVGCPELASLGDADAAVLYVLAGQLLGFFRCLAVHLMPDAPGQGVISRVVTSFTLHGRRAGARP